MSRYMHEDQTTAYRAVITATYDTGHTSTYYRGPYATKAAASQAISRAKNSGGWWPDNEVTGHVEESPLEWRPVSDQPGTGKIHRDSKGNRYINSGDESEDCWIRLGRCTEGRWFTWAEIRDR